MFSAPSPAVYSERRVRFLHRRAAGGIRADVASEWTRIIGEFDARDNDEDESEGDDVVDVGQSGDDGLVTRSKGHFTESIKEGLLHWKELSDKKRRRRDTLDGRESRVPLDGVAAGKDIVDDGAREVQVLPRPNTVRRTGWAQRMGDFFLGSPSTKHRKYGMGVVGNMFRRRFKRRRRDRTPQTHLDDFTDSRPYFTYWVTTVQVVVFLAAVLTYGFGPFGVGMARSTGLVLTEWLTLEQVDVREPANFWVGPSAKDLIHLGAKFTPCMRRDRLIVGKISREAEREAAEAGCCVKNDRSGCVTTSRRKCSKLLSVFHKWSADAPGPDQRTSGPVCGQDPRYCRTGAATWPDDIAAWPICHSRIDGADTGMPLPEHMSCEATARPCCVGIHGRCELRSEEFCSWVKGSYHPEATLCSQVSCMGDVCGMLPFADPRRPDQFYRLWTSLFLNAGVVHLSIVVFIQLYLMRDLEKLLGCLRLGLIYFGSGIVGNLASAVFIPYRAEVGASGALFGVLATFVVEVVKTWEILGSPWLALGQLLAVMGVLLLLGLVPWVDNYAHAFGFVTGLLLAYAILPELRKFPDGHEEEDDAAKVSRGKRAAAVVAAIAIFCILFTVFYTFAFDCAFCKLLSCLPIFDDFCAEQNIDFQTQPHDFRF